MVLSTAVQTSSCHVHFDLGTMYAAAPGGSTGPSGQHPGGDDPFVASTTAQPSNQVSIYDF